MEKTKQDLENQIKKATDAIYNQLNEYKILSKNTLVIGGIIVAAYAITKLFDDEEEVVSTRPTREEGSFFGSAITGLATSVALQFAKEKLLEYLENNQNEAA
jgi:L-asparagine transporter-like permease